MAASEHKFMWPNRGFTFDADDRVDPELFELACKSWQFLDETLPGLASKYDDPVYASRLLLVYFATRLHGATSAGTMLVAQRLGREAIIMSRCQYEYFLKMLYFDTYPAEADKAVKLVDEEAYEYHFQMSVNGDVKSRWSATRISRLEALKKDVKDPNFSVGIKEKLKRDVDFRKAAADGHPFARWFFANVDSTFATLWTYGSKIVHASLCDMKYVMPKPKPDEIMLNVDSRMKAPNLTIADMTQRCFSAMGIIRWRFGLDFTDEHTSFANRFQEVAARHKDEPKDIRAMHD